jgi:hypothetical protein
MPPATPLAFLQKNSTPRNKSPTSNIKQNTPKYQARLHLITPDALPFLPSAADFE